MWEKAAQASSRRVVDIRVTDNAGEVAKYITKPGAYLKLDENGARWCDADRLKVLHYALGSRRLIAWSRSLSVIRHELAFLKEDGTEEEDLIDVGEEDDGQGWVAFREVVYRWRRTEEGRMAYTLWTATPINRRDPWTCDHVEFSPDWYDDPDYDPDAGGCFQWS
jgi:hypothetical protein